MSTGNCPQCGRSFGAGRKDIACPLCDATTDKTFVGGDSESLVEPTFVQGLSKSELPSTKLSEPEDARHKCDDDGLDQPGTTSAGGGSTKTYATDLGTQTTARFGDYELLGEIARGGMGVVFRARQVSLNRRVALKMILTAHLASAEDIQRFYVEAEAAAKLDHPAIVPIYEVGDIDGQHFFSMGLVEGGSLAEMVEDGPLAAQQSARLVKAIADAVHYAHARNIVHRDLKPANILLEVDGQPKVTDFGLAKNFESDSAITATGQVMGTPSYMPPEQAAGRLNEVGPLADVYSLGAILYFLLTGGPPFRGGNVMETLSQVVQLEPMAPRRINHSIDVDVETICLKCLQKEPEKRFASAAELSDELGRYLSGHPIHSRPIGRCERAFKWIRRNKGLSVGLAAALLATVGGGIGVGFGFAEAEKQQIEKQLRTAAETERDAAKAARAAEQIARLEAQTARDKLARIEYGQSMQLAHQRWRDGNVNAALALLKDTPESLRGWEWRFVNKLCHAELLTIQADSDDALSVDVSPDGTRIVTGGVDEVARVWRTETGEKLFELEGHGFAVNHVCYNSDGTRILTSSGDSTFRIWDAESGEPLKVFDTKTGKPIFARSWSPENRFIVASGFDGLVQVWDAEAGHPVASLKGHRGQVRTAMFSPDGSKIATGGNSDRTARIWDAPTGKEIGEPLLHPGVVTSVSFSPDGLQLVTGCSDSLARVWDVETRERILTLRGHSDPVTFVAFGPHGKRIVTAGRDNIARIWNAITGDETSQLIGHTDRINAIAFDRDGSRVATSSRGGAVKLWDVRTNPEYYQLKAATDQRSSIRAVAFSPSGARVAATETTAKVRGSWLRVWNVATGRLVREALVHPRKPVRTVAFSPTGEMLLTTCDDGVVRILDLVDGGKIRSIAQHDSLVWSAVFSRDGTRIVTASEDSTIKVWDVSTGSHSLTISGPGAFSFADISPDNSRIVSAGREDNTARIWDLQTGEELWAMTLHTKPIWQARFSHDGTRILTVSGDWTARLWETESGNQEHVLRGHSEAVMSGVFSRDGSRVVTAAQDNTVKVWDTESGAELLTLKGHTRSVLSAAFDWDGSQIVSGGQDGTVRIWSAENSGPLSDP